MADAADQEARRLFGLARRAAKDTPVSVDLQKTFRDSVRAGQLEHVMNEAFDFTQQQLNGFHGFVLF